MSSIINSLPSAVDIHLFQGVDITYEFTLANADITLDTVTLKVYTLPDRKTLMFEKSNGPGDHHTPLSGITWFKFSHLDTVKAGQFFYEVRRTFGAADSSIGVSVGDDVAYIAGNLRVV